MHLINFIQCASNLIAEATANKYIGDDSSSVSEIVRSEVLLLEAHQISNVRPSSGNSSEVDIRNQVRCLWRIEYHWSLQSVPMPKLTEIHAVSYGLASSDILIRQSNAVSDFQGMLEVLPDQIPAQLAKLDGDLIAASEMGDSSISKKIQHIARLWSDVIRVHPFPDGNGRTARFAALLCLRRWGEPYIVTPKVRNDATWKNALDLSIGGDPSYLADILMKKVVEVRASPNPQAASNMYNK